jgi:hypothetical protein
MKATPRRFTADIVAAIHNSKILGIRAGQQPHRFIGIWVVVVEGRVFVRSWSLKPRSWYRTFLEDPYGLTSRSTKPGGPSSMPETSDVPNPGLRPRNWCRCCPANANVEK